MKLKELQGKLADLVERAESLIEDAESEDREFTEDEADSYDEIKEAIEQTKRAIERQKELDDTRDYLTASSAVAGATALLPEGDKPVISGVEDLEAKRPFESLGDQLFAVRNACIGAGVDKRLLEVRAATGLSEAVPADGGFLVQKDFADTLIKKVWGTGVLPPRCARIPIGPQFNGTKIPAINETSRADGSRWGGIRGYWADEAAEKTASKPAFRLIELTLNKLVGLCYATDELLQDEATLGAVVSQGFAEEFGFKIDDALINGTGAGQPLGILNAACLVSVAKETGQAATTIVAENIEKMYARLWARSIGNAVWLINQDCWPQIFQFSHTVGTGGAPMFVPAGGLTDAPAGTLLGRPIIPIEQCQTLGTKGDIYLVDFSQYLLAEKGGMQAASSIHVRFIYDETVFRFVYRVDGQPAWASALTPYKGATNTQSPFVALAARGA